MPLLQSRQDFQPYCPSGGTWYSCGAGVQFVGCCESDPCNANGCSAGNIRPASFNSSYYATFPDLECDSGAFYTCTGTDPAFLGCCRENACQAAGGAGCPQDSLTGAHLPNNAAKASAWNPTGGPSSTATSSSSASASSSSDSSSTSTAGIVGGVVGAVVVLLFVVGALIWRRRRKAKQAASSSLNGPDDSNSAPVSELAATKSVRGKGNSPQPPRYSAITNGGASYAFELDGYPRKPEPNTPSELGADELQAELPGEDAVHELEGSTVASTSTPPATHHSRGSSWTTVSSSSSSTTKKGGEGRRGSGPRGLAISGLRPHGHHHRFSPRSSPRSPQFPRDGGGGGGDETASDGAVSSLPSTPRTYAGTANYSDVSRLSPTYPPPIIEDQRGEGDRERERDRERRFRNSS